MGAYLASHLPAETNDVALQPTNIQGAQNETGVTQGLVVVSIFRAMTAEVHRWESPSSALAEVSWQRDRPRVVMKQGSIHSRVTLDLQRAGNNTPLD